MKDKATGNIDRGTAPSPKKATPTESYASRFQNFDLEKWEKEQIDKGSFENRASGQVGHEVF